MEFFELLAAHTLGEHPPNFAPCKNRYRVLDLFLPPAKKSADTAGRNTLERRRESMASVDVMKVTRANVNGLDVHLDNKKRAELNHSNKHINPELTRYNYYVGCKDWDECKKKMDARTAKSDAITPPQRKVKDRIVATMMEIPVPNAIREQGKEDEFLQEAYKQLQELYGAQNVHGMAVHKDEVHEYIDKDGSKKTSLIHAHALVSAYSTWKRKEKVLDENGSPKRDADGKLIKKETEVSGINGKHFVTRTMLNELHSSFNQMCLKKFGMEYLTHGDARKKSVEELKLESKYAADVVERMAEYEEELRKANENYKWENDFLKKRTETRQKELDEKKRELSAVKVDIERATERSKMLQDKNKGLEVLNSTLKEKNADLEQNIAQKSKKGLSLDRQLEDMAADVVVATERIKKENSEYERLMTSHKQEKVEILKNSLDYLRMRSQYDKKIEYLRKTMYIPEDTAEWDNTDWETWCLEQKYGSLESAIKDIDARVQTANKDMIEQIERMEQVSEFATNVLNEEPKQAYSIKKAVLKNDTVIQNASPEDVQKVFELAANLQTYLHQQQLINEQMQEEMAKKEKELEERKRKFDEEKAALSFKQREEMAIKISNATKSKNDEIKQKDAIIRKLNSKLNAYQKLETEYQFVKSALDTARKEEMNKGIQELKEVAGYDEYSKNNDFGFER